jgi:tRNA-dihydrouridine synthase B
MHIGRHQLHNRLIVAPMAGVTDRPFRKLCKRLGAALAVSEMVGCDPRLWSTAKSQRRTDHEGEVEPIAVQIAGGDPQMMANAARYNVERGAQIIDINMGCPAKKVCNVAAGSALLKDEALVARILSAVVEAVDVPVTLKMRTGWDGTQRNALRVAHIAQSAGVRALSIHGRTRACGFGGEAEYRTIAEVKSEVAIPVIANGDIGSPRKARQVLSETGADAIMIGRAAQGRPWLFREIAHFLDSGEELPPPTAAEVQALLCEHLHELYEFYGEDTGVRVARKHIAWYTKGLPEGKRLQDRVNTMLSASAQLAAVEMFFAQAGISNERLIYGEEELAA